MGSKKLEIDFWNSDTEKTFKKFRKELREKSTFSEYEIKDWLETLYAAVSSEYGNY